MNDKPRNEWNAVVSICEKYRTWRINAVIVTKCCDGMNDRLAFLRRLIDYNINLPNQMGLDLHDENFTMELREQFKQEALDIKQLLKDF